MLINVLAYLWIKLDQKQLQKFYSITNMSLLNCNYQQFKRISARRRIIIEKKVNITYGEKYLISYEFIQVECSDGSDKYLEYHSFLPKKQEVLERVHLNIMNESQNNQEDKLNVMILGIDTLSRLNFQRTMKKSRQTLDKLGGIEFFGYNKVGKF